MSNNSEKIPINYTVKDQNKLIINGGNIKMEEDFIFEGSNIKTITKKEDFNLEKALNEIEKINNLDYINQN